MSNQLCLLKYNNYFNRTVKGQSLTYLGDYLDDGATLISHISNMTLWKSNNGIDTEITSKIDMYAIPDYAILCDLDSDIVLSRWFVIEARRIGGGQYRLALHRDLIADNFAAIMDNADTYVERGWCDVSNNAIYNSEPLTFNQIKLGQTSLTDKSGSAWIVGYLALGQSFEDTTISFTDIFNNKYEIVITKELGSRLLAPFAAPYITFYMPYGGITFSDGLKVNDQLHLRAAQAISRQFSGSNTLMDLQILPFCPDTTIPQSYHAATVPTEHITINKVDGETRTAASYMGLISSTSSVSGTCYQKYGDAATIEATIPVEDIKTENQTKLYRLVSPNGNGVWEFNPARQVYANGTRTKLTYLINAMPYQPYIKVEPSFGRMYGNNYDDQRGLICGGDFSMPQINDAWTTYQIQNKNYQVMFNRQIESLDLQNKWGIASDIAGALSGTVSGAVGGSVIGGGIGAAAMGLASMAGGALDIYANQQLRADQREATIQQHNWQLDNIKALPYSVTKATNFNDEQPKFPYLEYYTADGTEITNFQQYLRLNGYTINRYGKPSTYLEPARRNSSGELATATTFIRCIPLKLATLTNDSHYASAIADECQRGFYFTNNSTEAGKYA